MATDLNAIPRDVWRSFVDGGGLDSVELLRHFRALTTVRLDPATAQEEADQQRQRFKRLIAELFPLDRLEAFIATLLNVGMYPRLRAFDLNAGLVQPFEKALVNEIEPVQAPFDLQAERMGQYGKGRLDASEYRYAVQLLQLRPALALSAMFLRAFLVLWARALAEASRSSLNAEQAPTFGFFFSSWNQGALVTILYPAIALHLRPHIELGGKQIDEPAFTRPLMGEVMTWVAAKGFFGRQTTVAGHGYEAKLTCAAIGMLNQALGKRGWLNTIFDKVVTDQRIPLMSEYLEQIVACGNRLAAFAEGPPATGSANGELHATP